MLFSLLPTCERKMASVGEPSHPKRPHIATEKMMEFKKTQGDTSPTKQLRCPVPGCSKVLTSAPGLKYHIQTNHTEMKEFACGGCGKVFKSANGLKYHCNKHKCSSESCSGNHSGTIDMSTTSQNFCGVTEVHRSGAEGVSSTASTKRIGAPVKRFIPPPLVLFPNSIESILNQPTVHQCCQPTTTIISPTCTNNQSRYFPATCAGSTTTCSSISTGCCGNHREENMGDSRLIEFAKIATSPQSPLMQHAPKKDWEQSRSVIRNIDMDSGEDRKSKPNVNLSKSHTAANSERCRIGVGGNIQQTNNTKDSNGNYYNDGSDSRVTSSSPFPSSPKEALNTSGTWSHNWPTPVWQCFIQDVLIRFILEGGVPQEPWQQVQVIARRDSLTARAARLENLPSLKYAPHGLRVLHLQQNDNIPESIHIHFTPDVIGQKNLIADCPKDHPFFVKDKGWSSCIPDATAAHFGIPCQDLAVGDICLPPSHPDATFSNNVFRSFKSFDFTPQDSSAVFTLSSMAKNKRDIEHAGSPTKKRSSKHADPLKAKRPMNAFMLFAQEKRLSLTQNFPGKDNRTISVILGDTWKKMSSGERSIYEDKAKVLAKEQKKIHPDCWKRKK
ncbi:hypothetical protein FSP39_002656 [Pinctada imbricata]|uniref:HMG box-containing protein 1 n=1 Tax=Pinctada imbricata TaxID=66713 RepID=A0AA88YAP1_PINIB|nr:hypothetical protein FSP39_002656 [Pinctada imbricata]